MKVVSSLPLDLLEHLLQYLDFWTIYRFWSTGDANLRQKFRRTRISAVLNGSDCQRPAWPSFFFSELHYIAKLVYFYSYRSFKKSSLTVDLSVLSKRLQVLDLEPPICDLRFGASLAELFPLLESFKLFSFTDIDLEPLLPFPATLKSLKLDWSNLPLPAVLSSLPRGLQTLHLESDINIPSMTVQWPSTLTYLFLDTNMVDHRALVGLPALWTLHLSVWYVEPTEEENRSIDSLVGVEEGEDGYWYYDIWPFLPRSLTYLHLSFHRYYEFFQTTFTRFDPQSLPVGLRVLELDLDGENACEVAPGGIASLWKALPEIEQIKSSCWEYDYGKITGNNISGVPSTYTHADLHPSLSVADLNTLPPSITSIEHLNYFRVSDPSLNLPPHLTALDVLPPDNCAHESSAPVPLRTSLPNSISKLVLARCTLEMPFLQLPHRLRELHFHTCLFNALPGFPFADVLKTLPSTLKALSMFSMGADPSEPDLFDVPESASFLPPSLRTLYIGVNQALLLLDNVYRFLDHIPQHIPLTKLTVIVSLNGGTFPTQAITPIPTALPTTLFELELTGRFDSSQFSRIPRQVRFLHLHTIAGCTSRYQTATSPQESHASLLPALARISLQ